jgi:prepilin signal peptidase PulO-like enzyme (type II secretory pathway)
MFLILLILLFYHFKLIISNIQLFSLLSLYFLLNMNFIKLDISEIYKIIKKIIFILILLVKKYIFKLTIKIKKHFDKIVMLL